MTKSVICDWNNLKLFNSRNTGPTTIFHKINSKEAISMWPDKHSFYQIHTFEPIVFFLVSLRKVDRVLRFTNFTDSNCSTFYRFHKSRLILARSFEFCETTNQNDSRDLFLIRHFTEFTNSSQSVRICEIGKTSNNLKLWNR